MDFRDILDTISSWMKRHKIITTFVILVILGALIPDPRGLSEKEKKELKEQYQSKISSEFDRIQESYAQLVEAYGVFAKGLGEGSIPMNIGYKFASNLEDSANKLMDSVDIIAPVENMSDDQIKMFHEVKNDYHDALISWIAICRDMQKMLDKGEFSNKKFEDIQIQLDNATACSVSAIQNKKKLDAMIDEIN